MRIETEVLDIAFEDSKASRAHLQGPEPTCFLSARAVRDGTAVALAQDVIDLAKFNALHIERFAAVGHD
jgi:hypothetical protein